MTEGVVEWSIVYLRPDGWWLAGAGFDSEAEATKAAEAHKWGGTSWRVIPSSDQDSTLCAEALDAR